MHGLNSAILTIFQKGLEWPCPQKVIKFFLFWDLMKYWKATLASAYSFTLIYSKITVCTVTAAPEIKKPEETFTKTKESIYEKPIEVYDLKPVTEISEEKSSNGMN